MPLPDDIIAERKRVAAPISGGSGHRDRRARCAHAAAGDCSCSLRRFPHRQAAGRAVCRARRQDLRSRRRDRRRRTARPLRRRLDRLSGREPHARALREPAGHDAHSPAQGQAGRLAVLRDARYASRLRPGAADHSVRASRRRRSGRRRELAPRALPRVGEVRRTASPTMPRSARIAEDNLALRLQHSLPRLGRERVARLPVRRAHTSSGNSRFAISSSPAPKSFPCCGGADTRAIRIPWRCDFVSLTRRMCHERTCTAPAFLTGYGVDIMTKKTFGQAGDLSGFAYRKSPPG